MLRQRLKRKSFIWEATPRKCQEKNKKVWTGRKKTNKRYKTKQAILWQEWLNPYRDLQKTVLNMDEIWPPWMPMKLECLPTPIPSWLRISRKLAFPANPLNAWTKMKPGQRVTDICERTLKRYWHSNKVGWVLTGISKLLWENGFILLEKIPARFEKHGTIHHSSWCHEVDAVSKEGRKMSCAIRNVYFWGVAWERWDRCRVPRQ